MSQSMWTSRRDGGSNLLQWPHPTPGAGTSHSWNPQSQYVDCEQQIASLEPGALQLPTPGSSPTHPWRTLRLSSALAMPSWWTEEQGDCRTCLRANRQEG